MELKIFIIIMASLTIMFCAFMWACVNIKKQENNEDEKET